ncbi:MAG: hypothetical protein P4L76_05925 [Beijerinckiaceae bacterium]|nr:hypothetical protein [Beijerinckiaceae bacterium]
MRLIKLVVCTAKGWIIGGGSAGRANSDVCSLANAAVMYRPLEFSNA